MGRSFHLSAAPRKSSWEKVLSSTSFQNGTSPTRPGCFSLEVTFPQRRHGNAEDQIRNQQKPAWSNISSHLSNICTFTAALTAKLLIFIENHTAFVQAGTRGALKTCRCGGGGADIREHESSHQHTQKETESETRFPRVSIIVCLKGGNTRQ